MKLKEGFKTDELSQNAKLHDVDDWAHRFDGFLADYLTYNSVVIEYQPNSFASAFDEEELDSLWDHLPWNDLPVDFTPPPIDESYLAHIQQFHGGKPLDTYAGGHRIERFLNFANPYCCPQNDQDFNVNVVRHWIQDRLDLWHMPFAAFAHGNYLCFDYSVAPRPSVFFWYHENPSEYQPIADDFDALLASVTRNP